MLVFVKILFIYCLIEPFLISIYILYSICIYEQKYHNFLVLEIKENKFCIKPETSYFL